MSRDFAAFAAVEVEDFEGDAGGFEDLDFLPRTVSGVSSLLLLERWGDLARSEGSWGGLEELVGVRKS